MQQPPDAATCSRAVQEIRDEYERRKRVNKRICSGIFPVRLRAYDALLDQLGLLPLGDRRLLDVGCGNAGWLDVCCRRWGAQEDRCLGVEMRSEVIERWQQAHPDVHIPVRCGALHEVELPESAFDIVHQSMMLSSVTDASLREDTARRLWRLRAPGGLVVSYDFWTNPTNPHTVGITMRELQRLFPEAQVRYYRKVTLAPPLTRLVRPLGVWAVSGLERLRVLNTHYLVALADKRA